MNYEKVEVDGKPSLQKAEVLQMKQIKNSFFLKISPFVLYINTHSV